MEEQNEGKVPAGKQLQGNPPKRMNLLLLIMGIAIVILTLVLVFMATLLNRPVPDTLAAPEIELEVVEGPVLEGSGKYRFEVAALISGNPAPKVFFSRDDSLGKAGECRALVFLDPGQTLTLMAEARNSQGSKESSIELLARTEPPPDGGAAAGPGEGTGKEGDKEKEGEKKENGKESPAVSFAFSPTAGPGGTEVKLALSEAVPAAVYYNGKVLPKKSSTDGKTLTVTLPGGAQSGYFELRWDEKIVKASQEFRVAHFTFSPTAGPGGTEVKLALSEAVPAAVYYNGRPLTKKSSADGKTLTVTIPAGAKSGYFELKWDGYTLKALREFKVFHFTFSPTGGPGGTEVKLALSEAVPAAVYYNGTLLAKKVSSDGKALTVNIPSGAESGYFELHWDGMIFKSSKWFTVSLQVVLMPPRGNTVGNIVNFGSVAKQGSSLYPDYNYVFYRSNDNHKIYKVHADGSRFKVNNDASAYINVLGEWVYYKNYSDGNGKLYKIRTSGSGRTKINDDLPYFINVVGDRIYYNNGDDKYRIYMIKTDGSDRTRLNDDSSQWVNVVGDWIYYSNISDGYKIYKIRTDGTGRERVNNEKSYYVNVLGDWVFYSNLDDGNKIYKIRTNGTGNTKVNNDWSDNINVVGDWAFYSNHDDGNKIYRIRIDGSGRAKVNNDESIHINVIDDWIYYKVYDDKWYRIHADGSGRQLVD